MQIIRKKFWKIVYHTYCIKIINETDLTTYTQGSFCTLKSLIVNIFNTQQVWNWNLNEKWKYFDIGLHWICRRCLYWPMENLNLSIFKWKLSRMFWFKINICVVFLFAIENQLAEISASLSSITWMVNY